jgi:methionyl-tRNA formyltransferase
MQMEAGLDTGPMLATVRTPIDRKTAGELTDELARKGAQLMVGTLRDLAIHIPVAQDDAEATHAPKIDKAEARLDWTQDAAQVERQVRAFTPWPGAFFEHEDTRVKVLAAQIAEGSGNPGTVLDDALTVACGSGALRLTRVQRAGKPAMDTADFQRGRAIAQGAHLD